MQPDVFGSHRTTPLGLLDLHTLKTNYSPNLGQSFFGQYALLNRDKIGKLHGLFVNLTIEARCGTAACARSCYSPGRYDATATDSFKLQRGQMR